MAWTFLLAKNIKRRPFFWSNKIFVKCVQKSKRMRSVAKEQLFTCGTQFGSFLCLHCTTTTWNCIISPFIELKNKRRERAKWEISSPVHARKPCFRFFILVVFMIINKTATWKIVWAQPGLRCTRRLFSVKYRFGKANQYSLQFSVIWGRLKISRWQFLSCTIFEAYLINPVRFCEV